MLRRKVSKTFQFRKVLYIPYLKLMHHFLYLKRQNQMKCFGKFQFFVEIYIFHVGFFC